MSGKIFTLPIVIEDIECITECWTHNRMAVLKTSPYYEDWIASRYNIYTTSQFNFRFGETWMYTPDYYDAILESRPVSLFRMTVGNIVEELKAKLENGYYLNMMIKPYKERERYHEVVFYGYNDDENIFLTVGIGEHTFQVMTFSYEYMKEMLPVLQENFRSNKQRGMELSLQYQYPIYAFKLRDNFNTDNCVFHAYKKISDELNGVYFNKHTLNAQSVYEMKSKVYRGIACLDGLVEMIHRMLAGAEMEAGCQGIAIAIQKLYEHRRMMLISMRYVLRKWDKAMKPETVEYIERYEKCCEIVQKWVKMAIKYQITEKKEILKKLAAEVPDVYKEEYNILNQFINNCLDWEKFNEYYI